eukprot:1436029-Prymnesium_polylepis.1
MVAMPMAAKQQVIARSGGWLFCLWSFMPIRRKRVQSASWRRLRCAPFEHDETCHTRHRLRVAAARVH